MAGQCLMPGYREHTSVWSFSRLSWAAVSCGRGNLDTPAGSRLPSPCSRLGYGVGEGVLLQGLVLLFM